MLALVLACAGFGVTPAQALDDEKLITSMEIQLGGKNGKVYPAEINQDRRTITLHLLANEAGQKALQKAKVTYEAKGKVTTAVNSMYQDLTSPVVYTVTAADGSSVDYSLETALSTIQRSYNFNGAKLLSDVSSSIYQSSKERRMAPQYLSGGGNDGKGMWFNLGYAFDQEGNPIEEETFGAIRVPKEDGNQVAMMEKTRTGGSLGMISLAGDREIVMETPMFRTSLRFRLDHAEAPGRIAEIGSGAVDRVILTKEGAGEHTYRIGWHTPGTEGDSIFSDTMLEEGKWYTLCYVFRQYPDTDAGYAVEFYLDGSYLGESAGPLFDGGQQVRPDGRLRAENTDGVYAYTYTNLYVAGAADATYTMRIDDFVNTAQTGAEAPYDDSGAAYEYEEEDPGDDDVPPSPDYDGVLDLGFEYGGAGWTLSPVNLIPNAGFEADEIWKRGTTDAAAVSYTSDRAYTGKRSAYFVYDQGRENIQAAWRNYNAYAINPLSTYQLGMAVIIDGIAADPDKYNAQLSFRTKNAAGTTIQNEEGGYCVLREDTADWVYVQDDYTSKSADETVIEQFAPRLRGETGMTAYVDDVFFGTIQRVERLGDVYRTETTRKDVYSGDGVLRVGGYNGLHGADQVISAGIPVRPWETYTAKVWTRTAGGDAAGAVGLTFFDASGEKLAEASSPGSADTVWNQQSVTLSAPEGAAEMRICLSAGGAGTVLFDNVSKDLEPQNLTSIQGAADRTVLLPERGARQIDLGLYAADQFGMRMREQPVAVTVTEAPAGITCADGILTVADAVQSGAEAVLTASAGTLEARFRVTLVRGKLKILGPGRITRTAGEQETAYQLQLTADGKESAVSGGQAVWSLTDSAAGRLTVDENGRLLVTERTPLGTYTLTAALKEDPEMRAELSIEIVRAAAGGNTGGGSGGPVSGGGGGAGAGGGNSAPRPTDPPQLDTVPAFTDVPADHWAYAAVTDFAKRGYISGRGENLFDCDAPVTRAEFLKILMLAMELEVRAYDIPFQDVPGDMWYYGYVATAYEAGLASGYDERNFGPEDPISRQDMAVLICRAMSLCGIAVSGQAGGTFADAAAIAPYAAEAVSALAGSGVITGMEDGTFAPLASATRAETVQLLYRVRGLREQAKAE